MMVIVVTIQVNDFVLDPSTIRPGSIHLAFFSSSCRDGFVIAPALGNFKTLHKAFRACHVSGFVRAQELEGGRMDAAVLTHTDCYARRATNRNLHFVREPIKELDGSFRGVFLVREDVGGFKIGRVCRIPSTPLFYEITQEV